MDTLTLSKLFHQRLFRIPIYQRGYAWKTRQLEQFWEDLVNIPDGKSHYAGLLTVQPVGQNEYSESRNERWLLDSGYDVFQVVDGQQRLTTIAILLATIVEEWTKRNPGLELRDIFLCDQSVESIVEKYLYRTKRSSGQRTYVLGYEENDSLFNFFQREILRDPNRSANIIASLYTANMKNARSFFETQIRGLTSLDIEGVFRKLITQVLINFYAIPDSIDVHVTFESMNNRGKPLSNLELLKNRLVYLATILPNTEKAEEKELVQSINTAWQEVYRNLGRNPNAALADDEFLRAHWIVYFKYSRKTGNQYIFDLLENRFSPRSVYQQKIADTGVTDLPEISDGHENEDLLGPDDADPENNENLQSPAKIDARYIHEYVRSLAEFSEHWYFIHFPEDSPYGETEKLWLKRMRRIQPVYFMPIIAAMFAKRESPAEIIETLQLIERFIFISFRMNEWRSSFGNSQLFRLIRDYFRPEGNVTVTLVDLRSEMQGLLGEKPSTSGFAARVEQRYRHGSGFYSWSGLYYFLYEYELEKQARNGQAKLQWEDFKKSKEDYVSIEHVMPQNYSNDHWRSVSEKYTDEQCRLLTHSLGNLLALSKSINSSLQDDSFDSKKEPKTNNKNEVIRTGYSEGSYSERDLVRKYPDWNGQSILSRGIEMLEFLEGRWLVSLGDRRDKVRLLQLEFVEEKS